MRITRRHVFRGWRRRFPLDRRLYRFSRDLDAPEADLASCIYQATYVDDTPLSGLKEESDEQLDRNEEIR